LPPNPSFVVSSELKKAASCPKLSCPDMKVLKTPGIGIELGISELGAM
jgi:hypothetical protein